MNRFFDNVLKDLRSIHKKMDGSSDNGYIVSMIMHFHSHSIGNKSTEKNYAHQVTKNRNSII